MIEKLKNTIKIVWPPKPWILMTVAVMFGVIGVFGLRNNNLQMVQLRDKVFVADKNNANLPEAMKDLQVFVFTHMNSSTKIELKYTYERAAEAAIKESSNITTGQGNIFDKLPNKRLYIHEFKSPILSFDFTGLCLLIAGASSLGAFGVFLVRFIKKEVDFYEGGIDEL